MGCASHRFNIFVRSLITRHKLVCEQVRKILKKLSCPVVVAKLRDYTNRTAQCSNVTRWSSTARMLTRYFETENYLLNIKEVEDMIIALQLARDLKRFCEVFSQLDMIGKNLQNETTSLADV